MTKIVISRATTRPILFLGGDRELVLVTMVWCFALAFTSNDLVIAAITGTVWLLVLHVLRKMAEYDPMLRKVYLAHLPYVIQRQRYKARSTPFRKNTSSQGRHYR